MTTKQLASAPNTTSREAEFEPSMTIDTFCRLEDFSRSFFYKLEKLGKAPKTYYAGTARRITAEERRAWHRARYLESTSA